MYDVISVIAILAILGTIYYLGDSFLKRMEAERWRREQERRIRNAPWGRINSAGMMM